MMARVWHILGILFVWLAPQAQARAEFWENFLQSSENQAKLTEITESPRTLNEIHWLHLGKEAKPARLKAIKNAQRSIYQVVPFWYSDSVGQEFLKAYERKARNSPKIDLRITMDWVSPFLNNDPLKIGHFQKIEAIPGIKVSYWNNPFSTVDGTFSLLDNRIHEKLLLIDGQTLFMGGMNLTDGSLLGGLHPVGGRDDEVMIRGPLVTQVQNHFLRHQAWVDYLDQDKTLPESRDKLARFLSAWFHPKKIDNRFLRNSSSSDRPISEESGAPISQNRMNKFYARWMYTNPLLDQSLAEKRSRSKMFELVQFLFSEAKQRIRIYLPYMTLSPKMENLIIQTAKRGVKVQIITNSESTNDMDKSYYAGLKHYLPFIGAGVELFEWQGHGELEQMELEYGCKIREWPGSKLHSKVILVDDAVTLIGSHNLNVRSEFYNSESVLMVEGSNFNKPFQAVFDKDIFRSFAKTVPCRDGYRKAVPIAKKVGKFRAQILWEENQEKIKEGLQMVEYL